MNSIFDFLPQPYPMQNPGMMMAPAQPPSYQNDINAKPMNLLDVVAQLTGTQNNINLQGSPKSYSGQIQEALGAKNPNEGGLAQQILSQRFQRPPTLDDVSQGAIQTLFGGGKPVSSQMVSDERMKSSLDQLSTLARMEYLNKGGGSGSVFAQTMEAINNDPELTNLSTMDKIRLAQNKLGTNLTMGPNGVSAMTGAPQALGQLAFGEKTGATQGQKNVEFSMNPLIEGATTAARVQAEKQGTAASTLPSVEQNTAYSQKLLQDLVSHPGLQYSQGISSYAPIIRGTDRADFEALRRQVGGTSFLQAFQSLKGGGQISNIEGEKATEAITRIMDPSLKPKDFIKAANDLNNILNIGLQRARGEAQGNFNQTFTPQDFGGQNLAPQGRVVHFNDLPD